MLSRREMMSRSLACLGGSMAGSVALAADAPRFKVRTLTSAPRHHFFGYYGMPPWNRSGKKLVCLESTFQDHMPGPEEAAAIGIVDQQSGEFAKIADTHAWNFQQGAMLHWNPLEPEKEIVFNDRRDKEVLGTVLDVESGKRRYLSRAVSAVSRQGKHALNLTYGRLGRLRKVVGYAGLADPNPDDPHPADDGVFLVDLATGRSKLIVSIKQAYDLLAARHPDLKTRHLWFNHTVYSRDDERFLFLARAWNEAGGRRRLESAMFTAGVDGSGLRQVIPFQIGVSHFDWRNAREIVATWPYQGKVSRHVLFTDGKEDYRVLAEQFLTSDGHCHFAPDGNWLVTDPPRDGGRRLLLFNVATNEEVEIGFFPLGDYLSGDLRCDLHPRWSRDGQAICFDALDRKSGTRQLHVASRQ